MPRPGLVKHPKFRRVCMQLRVPVPHLIGYLECLWSVAYENGEPVVGDATDIELAAEWPGEPGVLFAALVGAGGVGRAGFIEAVRGRDDLFQIHDLFDHAPDYVTNRRAKEQARKKPRSCDHCGGEFRSTESHAKFCCDACRVASHRESLRRDQDAAGGRSVTDGNEGVRNGNAVVTDGNAPPAPAPAPAPAEEPAAQASAAGAQPPTPATTPHQQGGRVKPKPEPPSGPSPAVMQFPCTRGRRSDAEVFELRQSLIDEWHQTFPAVDVLQVCRQAREWLRSHPKELKTEKNMRAWLSGVWLAKEQNRNRGTTNGRAARPSQQRPVSHIPATGDLPEFRAADDHAADGG